MMPDEKDDPLQPLSHRRRHGVIQDRLRDYIASNGLKAGDMLPNEETLAGRLGVSRAAIREALRALEALGIVEVRHGVGRLILLFSFKAILEALTYGVAFPTETLAEIFGIRKALDVHFIDEAIRNLSDEDIDTLSASVQDMIQRTESGLGIETEDHAFHQLLYRRSGNPLAMQLFEIAWQARLAIVDRSLIFEELPPGSAWDHERLLQTIMDGDEDRARELIGEHHSNMERRLAAELGREGPEVLSAATATR